MTLQPLGSRFQPIIVISGVSAAPRSGPRRVNLGQKTELVTW